MAKSTAVSMKLLVDTKANRVLFAEAGKDCVDFLFHILSLPLATVIRLLQVRGMEGSLPNLYKSLENLNDTYILQGKNMATYLKQAAPVFSSLMLAIENTSKFCICQEYVSGSLGGFCPDCGNIMGTNEAPPAAEDGGLVKGDVTYLVMDDLTINPMSTISSLALLNTLKVKDVRALEEKDVKLGTKEAIKLLKASLESSNVLTEIFC